MIGRRIILAFSFLLASLLYFALYLIAPKITLFQRDYYAAAVAPHFNIQIRSDYAVSQEDRSASGEEALLSRPGSIEDLFLRSEERLNPGASLAKDLLPVRDVEDRIVRETLERTFDLDRDEDFLKKVDAKVLEIAEDIARKEIEVARRLVRPSSNRLLAKDESPHLRSQLESEAPERLGFDAKVRSLLVEPITSDSAVEGGKETEGATKPPPEQESIAPPELVAITPSEAILERKILTAPVFEEAQALKEQSDYLFLDELVEISLDAYMPPDEKQGYFRLRIKPRSDKAVDVLPKSVCFVIDASSSIQQRKLNLTAKGIRASLASFRPEDYFNIVVFRDSRTPFRPALVAATKENIEAAETFLKKLESRGETDVYQAILPVLQEDPPQGAPGVVMVVSDGRPTTGIRDGRMIINSLTADNGLRNSIYAFGGGNTVNRYLLELLAYRNKGTAKVTQDLEDIDERLPQFVDTLRDPLLVNLAADYGRIAEETVYPRVLPDFYKQQPVEVYGRFDPTQDAEFVMRLSGQAREKKKELVFRADLAEAEVGDYEIARSWAFQKVYHLIGALSEQGEDPALMSELRELCAKYNIRTTYDQ